jgi:hypothetical protein
VSAATASLTISDRALLHAWRAWGRDDDHLWSRFEPAWAERIRAGAATSEGSGAEATSSREWLRREHAAEARADLSRVHPTWWIRGLREESPAVQLAVAAFAPPSIREAVKAGLAPDEGNLAAGRPPHPEALTWALALWTERLVGGPAVRPDDPPAIAALTRLDRHSQLRLIATVGLAKLAVALAEDDPESPSHASEGLRPRERERLALFRRNLGPTEPRMVRMARLDLVAARTGEPVLPRLGLTTIGRLLAAAQSHRVRWALQHLPYPVAKYVRSRMALANALMSGPTLVAWESRVFQAACSRLRDEGRLGEGWGVTP